MPTPSQVARTLAPFMERAATDLRPGMLPSFLLASVSPLAWEIGWPWVSGHAAPRSDLEMLAAMGLFCGRVPLLAGLPVLRPSNVPRGMRHAAEALRILSRSGLWLGEALEGGGVRALRALGPREPEREGVLFARSSVHRLERPSPPAGEPVVFLRVTLEGAEMAVWANAVSPDLCAQVREALDRGPTEDASVPGLAEAHRRLIVLRALVGGASAPLLGAFEEEPGRLDEDVETLVALAVRATLWRPVSLASQAAPGAIQLACADTDWGRAQAGEVARVGLGAVAERMRCMVHLRSRAAAEAWIWGADPERWRAAFAAFGRIAGWAGPGVVSEEAVDAGVPPVRPGDTPEDTRVRRLRHARWLLRPETRPRGLSENGAWHARVAVLRAFGLPEHLQIPLAQVASTRSARSAVARVASGIGCSLDALTIDRLPSDPWSLLDLQGVGTGSVTEIQNLLDPLLDEASRRALPPVAVAGDVLQEGLDALEALY